MKVAWNLKGGGIFGFTMAPDESPILHDFYISAIQSGCQKASYIVQFLRRDLTSEYDMIGPYFSVPSSMDSNILQEFFMLCLKAFTAFGFGVAIVLCDGASSNLTLLKILCGCPRETLPIDDQAETLKRTVFFQCLLLIQRILLENHDLPWFAQAIRYLSFSCKNKHGKSVSNMPSFWDTIFTYMNTSLHFNVSSEFTILSLIRCKRLTPVVQRVGNFIQHVRCYPADKLYWLEYILSTW